MLVNGSEDQRTVISLWAASHKAHYLSMKVYWEQLTEKVKSTNVLQILDKQWKY